MFRILTPVTRAALLLLVAALVAMPALAAEVLPFRPDEDVDRDARVLEKAALYQWLTSFESGEQAPFVVDVPREQVPTKERRELDATDEGRRGGLTALPGIGGPLQVGVHGDVGFTFDPTLARQPFGDTVFTDGMMVWTGTFRSPGAHGVRLQLARLALPKGAAIYVYDRHGQAFGPYEGQAKELWTNTVAGEEIVLQVHLPVAERFGALYAAKGLFEVTTLSHMGELYRFGFNAEKAFCAWNDSCITNAECASIPSGVAVLQDAAAYLLFDLPGGTYLCTGGLLNDTSSSGTPYLLTANHCFSTQSAATSLEAYFQWTVPCGGSCGTQFSPPGTVPRTNGSTLLATSSNTDFTFVELSQAAPSGSAFLGWSTTAVANSAGTQLYRVSHPSGSPQAYSEQQVNTTAGTCGGYPRGNYIYSDSTFGDTEGGSSGSPVVNGSGQVVGQLFGACGASPSTTCDTDDRTVDGAFAVTYPSIESWLDGGGGPPPGGGCTGNNVWTGTASGGGSLTTPNCSASGSFTGDLVCDAGAADLDLYLDKQSCSGWFGCSFSAVDSSTSAACDESISYSGTSGTYRWRVHHYSGPAEDFTLCTNKC